MEPVDPSTVGEGWWVVRDRESLELEAVHVWSRDTELMVEITGSSEVENVHLAWREFEFLRKLDLQEIVGEK